MKRTVYILVVFYIILLCLIQASCEKNSEKKGDLDFDSVYVGLYIDEPVWDGLIIATENILKSVNINYQIINTDTILNGNIDKYSVLLLTAGRPDLYYEELGSKGINNIRDYVRRGGGYIGICGSAYLASDVSIWRGWADSPRVMYEDRYGLDLYSGYSDGPIEEFAPTYITYSCEINTINWQHPISNALPPRFSYYYDHGPMFTNYTNDNNVTIIGESSKNGNAMILTTEYSRGRVFLTSGHPEVTNSTPCKILMIAGIYWCSRVEYEK